MQFEANNYSTAISSTENHDFIAICCEAKYKVYSWASKTGLCAIAWICHCFSGGSASACCTGIEESWVWTESGGLQLSGSILASLLKAALDKHACGHNHFAVHRSWEKTWETPKGFPQTPEAPLKLPMVAMQLQSKAQFKDCMSTMVSFVYLYSLGMIILAVSLYYHADNNS